MIAQLQTPFAAKLLGSDIPARLAFVDRSGHPHITPIWFIWRNQTFVVCARADSFKVKAITAHPRVALSIDTQTPPYRSVRARGAAEIEIVDGIASEYIECAHRYYGAHKGQQWIDWFTGVTERMARISITPDWAEVLDFEDRFATVFQD